MILPNEVHDVFLEILVDSELAVVLLSIHPVRPLDVRLALEDDDKRADTDLNKRDRGRPLMTSQNLPLA